MKRTVHSKLNTITGCIYTACHLKELILEMNDTSPKKLQPYIKRHGFQIEFRRIYDYAIKYDQFLNDILYGGFDESYDDLNKKWFFEEFNDGFLAWSGKRSNFFIYYFEIYNKVSNNLLKTPVPFPNYI